MSQESFLDGMTTPISLLPNQQLTLTCADRDNLDSLNYTVQWFKDLSVVATKNRLMFDAASPSDSGYYCCHVLRTDRSLVSRHCVTLWVKGESVHQRKPTIHVLIWSVDLAYCVATNQ